MSNTDVFIKIEGKGKLPLYASGEAAGCDLFAAEDIIVRPGETKVIPTGITIALPEGAEAQIRPRSGLSLRTSLRVPNSPGTIDSDYRNQVGVLLENTFNPALLPILAASDPDVIKTLDKYYRAVTLESYLQEIRPMDKLGLSSDDSVWQSFLGSVIFLDENNNPYGTVYIKEGDRIAQMVITRHLHANFVQHFAVEEIGNDRGGGFGSTGVR
ncbi:MAG: aminotransferase [Clostridiaceae bacterium]|nr:aminotransferase [Clostridiaceae bacterium]